MKRYRLLRITTVPISLKLLLRGQLSFFQSQGFQVMAVSADGPEVKDIQDESIVHNSVPFTRRITPFRDLLCLVLLIRMIVRFKPDIVHTHTPKAGLLGMLAAWLCRVPVRLHTVAGLPLMETTGFVRRLLVLTEKITYGCATQVYFNSFGLKSYIERNVTSLSNFKVIGKGSTNGIDTVFFSRTPQLAANAKKIREEFGLGADDLVFCFVGRIVKDKGISELIAAFRQLNKRQSSTRPFKLLLVGPFEQHLNPLPLSDYDFLHNSKNVILAGFQDDVRPWIMASNVFVFPSYREGFPNVVMQACCLEVPCIVSDINGCNEIIGHNQTGLIVPVKNSQALYEAMDTLSNDAMMRKSFGTRARMHVAENFDQKQLWTLLLSEYNSLLAKQVASG